MLLRLKRRLAAWEENRSVKEIQQLEFRTRDGRPDLRVSVYDVVDEHAVIVQTCAEHAAAVPLDPGRTIDSIPCDGTPHPVVISAGHLAFAFVRDHHREIMLADETALLGLIAFMRQRVRDPDGVRTVTKKEVLAYAQARVAAEDPEWTAAAQRGAEKKWLSSLISEARSVREE